MQDALPQTSALIANPYIVGRPLAGATASLYTGREETFDWLTENLMGAPRPNALLLHGRRRIGKTSTLYQLVEGKRGRDLRENPATPIIPAYVDLQRLVGRPTDEWLRRLARDICRRVNTAGLDPSIPDADANGATAFAAFDHCLDGLEATTPTGSLILLAIDEFEQIRAGIDAGTLDAAVLTFLRSQIQHRERVAFLICGSGALLEPFWRPIIDLTARFEIGPLDYDQTVALIREPMAGILPYEDEAVDLIWRQTGGHPYLIQSICHRLVGLTNQRHSRAAIQPADVEHVIGQMENDGYSGDIGFVRTNHQAVAQEGALL